MLRVTAIHSCDRIRKIAILRFLFKSVFCQAGNRHIKESWECSCVTKLMVSWKIYHCGCPSGVFLKKTATGSYQWELGSPLARKVPVQLRCLLFGIQAWSSTHNKWHVWQDPHTLPGNSTCLSASDSVLESVSQKVEYVPSSQRAQTIRLFKTKFSRGVWHLLWQWLAPNIRSKWPFWKAWFPFSRICWPI